MPANITADDLKPVLVEALSGLKALSADAIQQVANEYAPRLAAIAVSDDPAGERDDIMTNLGLSAAILGVKAESVAGTAVAAVIKVAAGVALKFAMAGLA